MRERVLRTTKNTLKARMGEHKLRIECILEDPQNYVSPHELVIRELEGAMLCQGMLDELAGFEDD